MSKIIYNPLQSVVSITISGKDYSVDAESEILVELDEHAEIWKNTHGFLEIRKVYAPVVEVKEEVVKEVVKEEVVDETYFPSKEVEVLVEEPKKAPKSKK